MIIGMIWVWWSRVGYAGSNGRVELDMQVVMAE